MILLRKLANSCQYLNTLNRRYPRVVDFIQLSRLHRPIGVYLLLWPTLWALWIAGKGAPSLLNLFVFIAGVALMRAAGCVINDYADRNVDGHVKRTTDRPLVTGKIHPKEAILFFAALILVSFMLVLLTNLLTIKLSLIALALACFYPFAKRYTHLPQVVLGAAFSWSIPMAYAAEGTSIDQTTWLLFLANLLWIVAYDTQYAMVDRDDDLKIGIKSTAILFGKRDNLITGILQLFTLFTLILLGDQLILGPVFYLSLSGAAGLFVYQQYLTRHRQRDACFKAFLSNHWVGAIIFIGVFLNYLG